MVYWIVTAIFCLQMSFTAYAQLVQRVDYRPALEKENTSDNFFSMSHLGSGPLLYRLGQAFIFPAAAHLGMHHILINSGKFFGQA